MALIQKLIMIQIRYTIKAAEKFFYRLEKCEKNLEKFYDDLNEVDYITEVRYCILFL